MVIQHHPTRTLEALKDVDQFFGAPSSTMDSTPPVGQAVTTACTARVEALNAKLNEVNESFTTLSPPLVDISPVQATKLQRGVPRSGGENFGSGKAQVNAKRFAKLIKALKEP